MADESTPDDLSAYAPADPTQGIQLDSIRLWDSSIERGPAGTIDVGDVQAQLNVQPSYDDDLDLLMYLIRGDYAFDNSAEERIVTIKASFLCSYRVDGGEPEAELVTGFLQSVVMHVTPFQREYLATITNRLGMPTFHLPLMRTRDIFPSLVDD